MCIKLETSKLDFFRFNQGRIRAELYQGLVDAFADGMSDSSQVGKRIVLPSSFIGGPRDMRQRYLDAMTLVSTYGKPDLFITMTCNPEWPEIKSNLRHGQAVQDRPDLVVRVFKAKLEELKNDLLKMHVFGHVSAYVSVVEFQKRGNPHVHLLLILSQDSKLRDCAAYDRAVCAQIPDQQSQPHLYSMVLHHMMHGPCGNLRPDNSCMLNEKKKCKSGYPKAFQHSTEKGENEYVLYKRRPNGRVVHIRGHELDNRWVVPYNPYLLAKYNCHINVEVCSTLDAVKYLYKYIYKGPDKVTFSIVPNVLTEPIDEISNYQMGRWISPQEAIWKLYAFRMYGMQPPVLTLHLHLEGRHMVCYNSANSVMNIISNPTIQRTMLTEFFRLNATDPSIRAMNLLYEEFPKYFFWDERAKTWIRRKKQFSVGRMPNVHPSEDERFYLKILLKHVRAPTSYDYLITVNDCKATTFQEAAVLRGLLVSDRTIEDAMDEAAQYKMPCELRRLFASVLAHCKPSNPAQLWEKHKHSMCEDILYEERNLITGLQAEAKALALIAVYLESIGKNIAEYNLVPNIEAILVEDLGKEILDELNIPIDIQDIAAANKLNPAQRYAYETILHKVDTMQPGMFFVDGPGGTGKTFLYRALLATIRSRGHIALATATSGVAASLLPGGRTAHSRFKIPIDLGCSRVCNVKKHSGLADLIRKSRLVIWDEAAMANKATIEMFDDMMRDLHSSNIAFGGKVIVFGGDFRQVLPVVPGGNKEAAIKANLISSYVWPLLQKLSLDQNMRASSDPNFSEYLMRIGNGTEPLSPTGSVTIPRDMQIVGSDEETCLEKLVDFVFPNLAMTNEISSLINNNAILTPKNHTVNDLNFRLISKFPGQLRTYLSFDETLDVNQQEEFEDILHHLTPSGMPPHKLELKINCPVMLLRNINPAEGLCNGTRLICRHFEQNVILCEIAVGNKKGEQVFIHRIPLIPENSKKYPIPFKRTQFPLRPSFAMTINKAQGQTLERVGLYLPEPVFSHGQLYVALSRAKVANSVKILIRQSFEEDDGEHETLNIVYKDLLLMAMSNRDSPNNMLH